MRLRHFIMNCLFASSLYMHINSDILIAKVIFFVLGTDSLYIIIIHIEEEVINYVQFCET